MSDKKKPRKPNVYSVIIQRIFDDHYVPGDMEFEFERDEVQPIAEELDIKLPKISATSFIHLDTEMNYQKASSLPLNLIWSGLSKVLDGQDIVLNK
ncbi:hypothetical protein [Vreelandella azerica]|uniref:hypothetical protein n=1 Tax=Vreelandella azerica TaxID=2732867 RepID=UPI001C105583|nr:hypothetical protein [Halomonas azerica]